MTNLDPESSPTLSHSPKPRMRIIIFYWWTTLRCYKLWTISDVIFSGLPSEIYQLGRLRRLIFYMWTTLRCISIGLSSTFDIFSMDYPPIIIIFRQPSEPFSLDLSHALTPIILGCSSAYGMDVCQFQYSLITYKYINTNILT